MSFTRATPGKWHMSEILRIIQFVLGTLNSGISASRGRKVSETDHGSRVQSVHLDLKRRIYPFFESLAVIDRQKAGTGRATEFLKQRVEPETNAGACAFASSLAESSPSCSTSAGQRAQHSSSQHSSYLVFSKEYSTYLVKTMCRMCM